MKTLPIAFILFFVSIGLSASYAQKKGGTTGGTIKNNTNTNYNSNSSNNTDSNASEEKINNTTVDAGKSEAISAIGSLTAMTIYNTYLVLAETGDAFSKETYDAKMTIRLCSEQIGMLDKQVEAITSLKNTFFTASNDVQFIDDCVEIFKSLKDQARALKSFADGGDESYATKFETLRKSNWTKISNILGFDE